MKRTKKEKYIFILLFAVVIIIFIGNTLARFNRNIQEEIYNLQIKSIKNLSMQGSAVVEKKLEGYINTLYGMTEFLKDTDLSDEKNIKNLQEYLDQRDTGFQRLALADINGNSSVTNGERLNISDRNFFQDCVYNRRTGIEIRESSITKELICIVAVPVLSDTKTVKGVLYGITELRVFNIYNNTVLENEAQYIQIIDQDGTYIKKEASNLLGKKDNIFDGLATVESNVSIQDIRQKIQNDEQLFTEITDGSSKEVVYFTPLKINDWCVVTVMDYSQAIDTAEEILGTRVYAMIFQVTIVVILLFLLILYFSWQEQKQMRQFNEQMLLDEKIVRIAAEKSGVMIMSYTVKTKQLRFINNALQDLQFPQQVENAPVEFMKYVPDDRKLQKQIQEIFERMETNTGRREYYLCIHRKKRDMYLKVQLTTLIDKYGGIRQCVGTIEDVTEEQELREKADRDSLTGLYNRSKAANIINECLNNGKTDNGKIHVCMIMDLDNFKTLNDTLGHQTGDRALRDVSRILKQHFREYDIVCRLGGDEFLIFLKNIPKDVVRKNITSLLHKLDLTYDDGENFVRITASAGIALVDEPGLDLSEIYRRADKALYEVKHELKNNFRIYGESEEA